MKPWSPARIASLGLFEEGGITTSGVLLEEKDGILALVPTPRALLARLVDDLEPEAVELLLVVAERLRGPAPWRRLLEVLILAEEQAGCR